MIPVIAGLASRGFLKRGTTLRLISCYSEFKRKRFVKIQPSAFPLRMKHILPFHRLLNTMLYQLVRHFSSEKVDEGKFEFKDRHPRIEGIFGS